MSPPVDPRLLRRARAARTQLVTAGAVGVASAALVVVQAFAIADLVVGPFQQGATLAELRGPLTALALAVLGRGLLAWASDVAAHRASAQVKSELRRALLAQTVRLGPAWLARQRVGELATLATRGVDALDGYFARYLPALVTAAVVPAAVVAVVLTQDLLSAVVIALTLPLVPVFAVLVGLATRRRTERQWRVLTALGGHFLDVVEGLPTLVVLRRAKAQAATIRRVADEHRRATMGTLRLAFLSSAVLELVATISVALVAVSIGLRLVDGGIDLRTGLVVLVLAPEAYWPLRQVGAHFHASAEGLAAAERVLAVLETPVAGATATGAEEPEPVGGRAVPAPGPVAVGSDAGQVGVPDLRRTAIRLEAVSIAYDRERPALAPVTLELAPGEHVGLCGPSGAGKSTLLAVLLRFVEPTAGRVVLDDGVRRIDLASLDPDAWRAQVAWVPQHPWLAAASVADNVRLGRPDATDAEVEAALAAAHAREFVAALPDGMRTPLGEGGYGLSAGQRQRIAVARAFLRDAPLVLLDEPTAHLDADSEAAVGAAIRELGCGRTVLAVAHRPALLAAADRIVTLPAAERGAARAAEQAAVAAGAERVVALPRRLEPAASPEPLPEAVR